MNVRPASIGALLSLVSVSWIFACGSSGDGGASVPDSGTMSCTGSSCDASVPINVGDSAKAEGAADASDASEASDASDVDAATMGCVDAQSCPPVPPGPCSTLGAVTCMNNACGVTYTPGVAPSQQYGNCKKNACDASGKLTATIDDTNIFSNGSACMTYGCANGNVTTNNTVGKACTRGPVTGVCEAVNPDASGLVACAECDPLVVNTCSGVPAAPNCVQGRCVPSHCMDQVKDTDETDVDCGGSCIPCADGHQCASTNDCFSGACTGVPATCKAPSCSDAQQNGTETDVDCGGSSCPKCSATAACLVAADCASGVCRSSGAAQPATCQASTCTDGVMNGDETGVDCGNRMDAGAGCPPCAIP